MATAEMFDSVIASSGRLRILAALAAEPRLEFVWLRKATHLTDGNLATHTRRLETAGFVTIEKSFRHRKPVTHVKLTTVGRDALEKHARELLAVLGIKPQTAQAFPIDPPTALEMTEVTQEDWVD
jgi:DNA-binding MarR family transcriptional regulator